MDGTDLLGGIAPVLLSWLIILVATLTGDFVEGRAQQIANDLSDPNASVALRADIAREIASLVKGASLASALISMIISYLYAAYVFLDKIKSFWWTFCVVTWGALAIIYIGQACFTFRPYQWDQHFVVKPWGRWSSSSTFRFTHFGLLSAILTLSGGIVIVGNIAAYIAVNTARAPVKEVTHILSNQSMPESAKPVTAAVGNGGQVLDPRAGSPRVNK